MTMTLAAKSPEDLLAAVPVVLGFKPHEDLVMLTFGAEHQFHARIDLPGRGDIDECVETVLAPARTHAVRAVVFILYTTSAALAHDLARELVDRFEAVGIRVLDVLRADGERWFAPFGRAGVPPGGVPYDEDAHEFAAEAVLDGRVRLGSREALAAKIAPDADLVAQTEAALSGATALSVGGLAGVLGRARRSGRIGEADDLASLLLALRRPAVLYRLCAELDPVSAPELLPLWEDIVRRTPTALVAPPAGVLALVAWLAGDGALAWCGVDRCFQGEIDHLLGRLVSALLTDAAPPKVWGTRVCTALAAVSAAAGRAVAG
ncbi:MAG: DUF4192 domain-containing protein [Nocardioides sp.]|uniref:DUF4192 domain-containing protein n=1 Tax=Nocardioides sp. TaxID=35761 RepID=UPI0039E4A914